MHAMKNDTNPAGLTGQKGAAPATVTGDAQGASGLEPEFIPLPDAKRTCPYSGLTRGTLYTLINEGLIRSVSLRRPGKSRCRRLIVFASLRDYLRKLDAEQNNGGAVK